jgi:hypothetical protein
MENQLWESLTRCTTLIKELGFPIFVAIWMLVIHDRAMKKLTNAINSLTRAFDKANILINNDKKGGDLKNGTR